MGHEDHGPVGAGGMDRPLDAPLADVVEGRGPFVKNQDRRVLEEDAGQGDPLPLAAGKVLAPLGDPGLEVALHGQDLLIDAGHLCGFADLVHRGVFAAVGDVVGDRPGEDERVLADIADQVANRFARDRVDRDPRPGSGRRPTGGSTAS